MTIAVLTGTDTYGYVKNPDGTRATADVVVAIPNGVPGYPSGAVALSAGSADVANASAVATLTGTATTTVYITGFQVSGSGATAGAVVAVTIAGLLGGTRTYNYTFATGAAVGNQPLIVQFLVPLPASAVNTAIVVTCPASGAGGAHNTVNAQGFYV
jgi:hypothetical protein